MGLQSRQQVPSQPSQQSARKQFLETGNEMQRALTVTGEVMPTVVEAMTEGEGERESEQTTCLHRSRHFVTLRIKMTAEWSVRMVGQVR